MVIANNQPPSGGCVLKPLLVQLYYAYNNQPPSGGCVLKLQHPLNALIEVHPSRLQAAVC